MKVKDLQMAIVILEKYGLAGNIFGYHDEVQIYPERYDFSEGDKSALEKMGFHPTECEEGFMCFT